jgi:hypothetical protein
MTFISTIWTRPEPAIFSILYGFQEIFTNLKVNNSLTKLHVFIHLASVAKPQVFYYLVSDAKNIRYNIPIITLVGV